MLKGLNFARSVRFVAAWLSERQELDTRDGNPRP
jgi:hypothetical protein